jgi:hypothetical protein
MTAVTTLHRMKNFVRPIPVLVTRKWHWAMQKKLFWWNCLFAASTAEVTFFGRRQTRLIFAFALSA